MRRDTGASSLPAGPSVNKKGPSLDPNPAGTLTSDPQPPMRNPHLFLVPPAYGILLGKAE